MKSIKLFLIIIILSNIIYSQSSSNNELYKSSNGINLSIILPLTYSVGYDFTINSNSTFRTSAYYATNKSDDGKNRVNSYTLLPTGKYSQWEDSFSSYVFGISFNYLYDIYKYSESKLYSGIGSKLHYGESESENSRELNLIDLYQQSSMSSSTKDKGISLDLLFGYEYLISEKLKVFSEIIYDLSWINTDETIRDGWERKIKDFSNLESEGLSPAKDELKNYWLNSNEFNLRLGFIVSL